MRASDPGTFPTSGEITSNAVVIKTIRINFAKIPILKSSCCLPGFLLVSLVIKAEIPMSAKIDAKADSVKA
jgi:hypothetical protein